MPKRYLTGGGNNLKNQRKSSWYLSKFAEKLKLLPENLKNLFKKLAASVNCRSAKNPFTRFFRKRSLGVAILETAMTLPIVLYVIFFAVELVRIELAQTAVDAITKEFTFYLMAKGKVVQPEVDAIFLKYKPWGIPIGNFRYYIRLYPHMTSPDGGTTKGIMDQKPWGGETICWPGADYRNPDQSKTPSQNASGKSYYGTGNVSGDDKAEFFRYRTAWTAGDYWGEVGANTRKRLLGSGVPSGYVFVLTVAVVFPFSSPFVKKLFNGGSNTVQNGSTERADAYILWARGSGMIN